MSSSPPKIPSKVFSALTGEEIKKIILKQIEDAFDNDDNFHPSLTYPVVEFEWEMKMRSYPSRGQTIHLSTKGKARAEGELPELEKEPFHSTLKGSEKTDQPDRTRSEHGMPITRPELRNGRYVDVPTVEVPPKPPLGMPDVE